MFCFVNLFIAFSWAVLFKLNLSHSLYWETLLSRCVHNADGGHVLQIHGKHRARFHKCLLTDTIFEWIHFVSSSFVYHFMEWNMPWPSGKCKECKDEKNSKIHWNCADADCWYLPTYTQNNSACSDSSYIEVRVSWLLLSWFFFALLKRFKLTQLILSIRCSFQTIRISTTKFGHLLNGRIPNPKR